MQNPDCRIVRNANPTRKVDYIVIPNIPAVQSFNTVDFHQTSSIMRATLATVQGLLKQLELPAFTVICTESDIRNMGRFSLRIVSGEKIS